MTENIDINFKKPKCDLPECIKERIRYFKPQMDKGLSFERCMQYILATQKTEDELWKDYFNTAIYARYQVFGISWLSVSHEVQEWHASPDSENADKKVAAALLYGLDDELYQVKYGDYYLNNCDLLVPDSNDFTYFSKEAAEKKSLLKAEYLRRDVHICDFVHSVRSIKDIEKDTEILDKYNSTDYVFLFKIGQQIIGMNAEPIHSGEPECFHFAEAVKILQSIQNIKPKIIKAKQAEEAHE